MFALDGVGANDNIYDPNYTDDPINDEQRNDVYHEWLWCASNNIL